MVESVAYNRVHEPVLAILAFHKIGEPPVDGWETWFYVPEETFAGYLRYLDENDWQIIDVSTLLNGLVDPNALPRRAALLTFDDGYRSMRQVALPWLRRFGYPAVLFVPTDFIGRQNSFDADSEPVEDICDWDDLTELARGGVSIQSHGAAHHSFSNLPMAQRDEELQRSKAALESRLGQTVEIFSYPYGDGGKEPVLTRQALQRAGYRAACLYGGGANLVPIADPFRLDRLAMGPDTDLASALRRGDRSAEDAHG
ncbi:MAG: polysaccharide deacetylase family protein [Acidobacteria bacterium]|nr:polysaccharide deacetylase family protein [Acidobacteriota bacterium]